VAAGSAAAITHVVEAFGARAWAAGTAVLRSALAVVVVPAAEVVSAVEVTVAAPAPPDGAVLVAGVVVGPPDVVAVPMFVLAGGPATTFEVLVVEVAGLLDVTAVMFVAAGVPLPAPTFPAEPGGIGDDVVGPGLAVPAPLGEALVPDPVACGVEVVAARGAPDVLAESEAGVEDALAETGKGLVAPDVVVVVLELVAPPK
jgi:hypothetical protein